MLKDNKYIGIILTTLLLIILGFFIFNDLSGDDKNNKLDHDSGTLTDAEDQEFISDLLPDIPSPSLDRSFVIPDIFSDEIREETMKQYNEIVNSLEENPKLRDEWLQLALLRNSVKDYEGAEDIWIYLTQLFPLDPVAFGNLGYLYMNTLVDYKKADENLRLAVEKNPTLVQNAQNLYDLNRHRLDDPDTAVDLLIQAGEAVPHILFYPVRIAEHYRDIGNTREAKKYFEISLQLAEEQKDTNIINYVTTEIEKIQ